MSAMKPTGLLVLNPDGSAAEATLCNEKSRAKTVERGELWIVDPATHRVLPYRGGAGIDGTFIDRGGWFAVQLVTMVDSPQEPGAPDPAQGGPASSRSGRPEQAGVERSRTTAMESTVGTVLSALTGVIRERHATMPEGSYTTHLFSKGIDKIRKKTGEEAVELILARDNGEIVSEGADLVYHMMVLLEAAGLSIDDVITVLRERYTRG